MATINFPTSPALNDPYTINGRTWAWNGSSWINTTSGYVGSQGNIGFTGSIGYTGSASTVIGYTGSAGANGYTGSSGYTGSASTAAGYTGSKGGADLAINDMTTGTAVNCSLGNYFIKSISGNTTFTFTNVPTSIAYSFTLELTHTSGTVTWPSTVRWPDNAAPTLTTGRTHIFVFLTDDSGTIWRAAYNTNYLST